jgi:xanthine dehydrogenase accessory factor
MLDVLQTARQHPGDLGRASMCAVATIVGTDGSVPRPVGTSMVVHADGRIEGSLSGGCVEGAVLEACQEAMARGEASLERFGYSDEDAFAVGLMCGGTLEVMVQPLAGPMALNAPQDPSAVVLRLPSRVGDEGSSKALPPVVLGTEDDIPTSLASLLPPEVLESGTRQVASMIRGGRTGTVRLAPPGGHGEPIELFVETHVRPAHLIVYGANTFGQALVAVARPLGLHMTLCDQRPAFTDPASFPGAEVVRAWPHEHLAAACERGEVDHRSMICVLSHDPKVDVPVLARALELKVAYVGAMGSRRSDRDRRRALEEAGVTAEALSRLHSPIGLDLGAITPAEVAVAILAEVLAVREGRTRISRLSAGEGELHGSPG